MWVTMAEIVWKIITGRGTDTDKNDLSPSALTPNEELWVGVCQQKSDVLGGVGGVYPIDVEVQKDIVPVIALKHVVQT